MKMANMKGRAGNHQTNLKNTAKIVIFVLFFFFFSLFFNFFFFFIFEERLTKEVEKARLEKIERSSLEREHAETLVHAGRVA